MSSHSNSAPIPSRKIAPLPVRARSSSRQTGTSQDVGHANDLSQQSSSISPTSHRRHSYHHLDGSPNDHHLSPPLPLSPERAFRSDQTVVRSQAEEHHGTFTFRLLHNVTPRPSPEPEETPFPNPKTSSTGPSSSWLRSLSTPEHEYPQLVHTLYSDEKIPILGGSELLEPAIVPGVSPSPPALSVTQPSDAPRITILHSRSTSDTSFVSERDEALQPYDLRDEQAPLEPFFTPAFQGALRNGLGIAQDVVADIESLDTSSEAEPDLHRLLTDAKGLSTFQSSNTRTIAVLGDSGEGKSSLINSLLHFPEIAKTGDIGSACTSVVTEYRQKTRDHTAPITIEAEYLSSSEIDEHINELLWSYRQVHLPNMEDDAADNKEYMRIQRESEQAWSALEAAFKHQRQFKKELLSDMSEEGLQKATDRLLQWAHEIDWPKGGKPGMWTSSANTAEECCEKTSIFMQDRYWPFMKIIRVYLSAQVLKTGVVLADLPGLQDTNLARVRATQTYLIRCDYVFLVAKISRAITDQSLKSSLYTVVARHVPLEWEESAGKGLNLAVVCTKSEDINYSTARREFCGPHKTIAPSVMERLDRDIERSKAAGNRGLKKELKRKQELLLRNARNKHVKDGLQKAYASKVPGGKLEVFCVSNTTYEKYAKKGNGDMVSASGIPELRRFCHSVTADAQLLEAKHFLKSKLASLLNSLELWAGTPLPPPSDDDEADDDSGPDESIIEALENVEADVSKAIRSSRISFDNTFKELIAQSLSKFTYKVQYRSENLANCEVDRRNDFWDKAAAHKGSEWLRWHHCNNLTIVVTPSLTTNHGILVTYQAWCRHHGEYETPAQARVNWNAELIWKMRMELAYQWDILEGEVQDVFKDLLLLIKGSLLDLKSTIQERKFSPTLVGGIGFRIQDIEYKFCLAQQKFASELRLIRTNACEPTGYILSEMTPAYRSAAGEGGSGMKSRMHTKVQGRIENGTLFPNISFAISKAMGDLTQKTFRDLKQEIELLFGFIRDDVDMALATSAARRYADSDEDEDDDDDDDDEAERMAANALREVFKEKLSGLKERYDDVVRSIAAY